MISTEKALMNSARLVGEKSAEIIILKEALKRIHELSEQALFERTSRAAAQEALRVLSEINKLTASYT